MSTQEPAGQAHAPTLTSLPRVEDLPKTRGWLSPSRVSARRFRQESDRRRADLVNQAKAEARETTSNSERQSNQELREAEARAARSARSGPAGTPGRRGCTGARGVRRRADRAAGEPRAARQAS